MASEKITKFIDDIKTLSVLELSELIDAIQEEFGVTAVMAAAPAAGAGAAAGLSRPPLERRRHRGSQERQGGAGAHRAGRGPLGMRCQGTARRFRERVRP